MYPAPPVTKIRNFPYPLSFMLNGSLLRQTFYNPRGKSLEAKA